MTRQIYIVLVYQDLSNYNFLYIFSRNVIEVIFAWKKQSTVTKNILNIISILGNYNIPLFIFIFSFWFFKPLNSWKWLTDNFSL